MYKTKLKCFRSTLKSLHPNLSVLLHLCVVQSNTSMTKYLGTLFDSDLKSFLSLSVRKLIMPALAYSALRNGTTVYADCSTRWHIKIDNILKNALKSIIQTVVLKYYCSPYFRSPHWSRRTLWATTRFCIPRTYNEFQRFVRNCLDYLQSLS